MEKSADHCTNFWQATKLIINKPHIINRRLAGAVLLSQLDCGNAFLSKEIQLKIVNDLESLALILDEGAITNNIKTILNKYNINVGEWAWSKLKDTSKSCTCIIIINKLLAKNLKLYKSSYEIVFLGK